MIVIGIRAKKIKIILLNRRSRRRKNGHPFPRGSKKVIISQVVSKLIMTMKSKVCNYIHLIIRGQPFNRSFMRFTFLNSMLSDTVHICMRARRHLSFSIWDTFILITKRNLVMNEMKERGWFSELSQVLMIHVQVSSRLAAKFLLMRRKR